MRPDEMRKLLSMTAEVSAAGKQPHAKGDITLALNDVWSQSVRGLHPTALWFTL